MHTNSKIDLEQVDSKNEKATRRSKSRSWFSNAAMVLLLANLVGVVCIYASGRSSTTSIQNRRLVDGHGDTVQVALKDVEVDIGGNLVSRSTGNPLHTATTSKTRHSLTSLIPDKYLVELEYFSYKDQLNNEVYVKVHSFARHPEEDAHCGSIVKLVTSNGNFTLDDTHLYHADGKKTTVAGHFDVERRLGMQHGRKLYSKELDGFFAFIEKSDFKCTQEWKGEKTKVMPEIPKVPYTLTEYQEYSCEADRDKCFSMVGENVRELKPGVTEDGQSILAISQVLVTESQKITITYMPNQPTSKKVSISNTDGSKQTFQLFKEDTTKLHCQTKDPSWFSNRRALKRKDGSERKDLQQSLQARWKRLHNNQTLLSQAKAENVNVDQTFKEFEKAALDAFDQRLKERWAKLDAEANTHAQTPATGHNFDDSFVSYLGTATDTYKGRKTRLRHFALVKKAMVNDNINAVKFPSGRQPVFFNYYDTAQKPHMPYKLHVDVDDSDIISKVAGENSRNPKPILRMLNFKGGLSDDDVNAWLRRQFSREIDSTDALNTYAKTECNNDEVRESLPDIRKVPLMHINPFFEAKEHVKFHAEHYDPNSKNLRNMPITERLYWSAAQKSCAQPKLSLHVDGELHATTSRALESRRLNYVFEEQKTASGLTGKCLVGGSQPRWHYFHNKRGLSKDSCETACDDLGIDNCAGYMYQTGGLACGLIFGNGCKNQGCSDLNYYHGSFRSHVLGSVKGDQTAINGAHNENSWTCWKAVAVPEPEPEPEPEAEPEQYTGSCPDVTADGDYIKCRWKETLLASIDDSFVSDLLSGVMDALNIYCDSGVANCPVFPDISSVRVPTSAHDVCTLVVDLLAIGGKSELVTTLDPFGGFLKNTLSMLFDMGVVMSTDDGCRFEFYGKMYSEGLERKVAGLTVTPAVEVKLGQEIVLRPSGAIEFPPLIFHAEISLAVVRAFCVSGEFEIQPYTVFGATVLDYSSGALGVTGEIGGSIAIGLTRDRFNDPPYCPEGYGEVSLWSEARISYADDLRQATCRCADQTIGLDVELPLPQWLIDLDVLPEIRVGGFIAPDDSSLVSTGPGVRCNGNEGACVHGSSSDQCPNAGMFISVQVTATINMLNLCAEEEVDLVGELTASATVGVDCTPTNVWASVFTGHEWVCNCPRWGCGGTFGCDLDREAQYRLEPVIDSRTGEQKQEWDCWTDITVSMDDPVKFLDEQNITPGPSLFKRG